MSSELHRILNIILIWTIFGLGILNIINNPTNLYPPAILFSLFLVIIAVSYIFNLNERDKSLVILLLFLEIIGESFGFGLYTSIFFYDKILHFIAFGILTFIIYYKLDMIKDKKYRILLSIIASFGIALVVEFYEWIYDKLFQQGMQGVYSSEFHLLMDSSIDTVWDMICGVVGSIVASIYIYKK